MLGQVSFEGPSSHPHFMAFEHYESLWKEVNVLDQSNPIWFRIIPVNPKIYLIGAKVEMLSVRGAVFKFDIQKKYWLWVNLKTWLPKLTRHIIMFQWEVIGLTEYRTHFGLSVVGHVIYIIGRKRNERDLDEVEAFDTKANTIRQCQGTLHYYATFTWLIDWQLLLRN